MMGASRPGQATLAALWSGPLLVVVALHYMPTSSFSSMLETRRPRSRLRSHRASEAILLVSPLPYQQLRDPRRGRRFVGQRGEESKVVP